MIYLKGAMALLDATGLLGKLIAAGVLVASLLTIYGVWHHKVYQSGVDDTIAKVARADQRTIERAMKMRAPLVDCESRNLEWDMTTGRCK